jgi:Na+/melibiose symporter-like transporter
MPIARPPAVRAHAGREQVMTDAGAERELGSFRAKFFLAVGSIGWGVKDAGITSLLLLYYSQVVGVPGRLVGLAIGIALVFDAIIDPIIGIASDNSKSRWGRRLPFMYVAGVPVGVLYFFLWQPPHGSPFGQFLYLLVIAIAVRGFIALFEIPSTALVPELTSDYNKRTEFLNWRYLMGIMGATVITYVTFRFLLVPDKLHPVGQLNPAGYPRYALIASVIMTLSILISCLGLHRYIPYFQKTSPRYSGLGQFFREIWQTLTLKVFRVLLVSGVFSNAAAGLNAALGTIFLTYFWKLSNTQVALFQVAGVLGALLAFGVFVPLSKLFEKRIGAVSMSLIAIVAGTGPYIIALFGWRPDIASDPALLWGLLGLFVILAAIAITALVLVGSMMADVVEQGALETGRRTEGTFFAATSFINKVASGVGVFLGGIMTDAAGLHGHVLPSQLDPSVMRNLFLYFVPVIVVLHTGAILSFLQYRITRAQHEDNVRRLRERMPATEIVTPDGPVLGGELTIPGDTPIRPAAAAPGE